MNKFCTFGKRDPVLRDDHSATMMILPDITIPQVSVKNMCQIAQLIVYNASMTIKDSNTFV